MVAGTRGARRAASEVLGAAIIAVITILMTVAYAGYGLTQAQTQTASISDLLRMSARAQRQLLSLTYYYVDGQGGLHVFIYNLGGEDSTLKTVVVGSTRYDLPNAQVRLKDALSGQFMDDCRIPPRKLAELTVPAPAGQFDMIVLTDEGGVFIWRLNV